MVIRRVRDWARTAGLEDVLAQEGLAVMIKHISSKGLKFRDVVKGDQLAPEIINEILKKYPESAHSLPVLLNEWMPFRLDREKIKAAAEGLLRSQRPERVEAAPHIEALLRAVETEEEFEPLRSTRPLKPTEPLESYEMLPAILGGRMLR